MTRQVSLLTPHTPRARLHMASLPASACQRLFVTHVHAHTHTNAHASAWILAAESGGNAQGPQIEQLLERLESDIWSRLPESCVVAWERCVHLSVAGEALPGRGGCMEMTIGHMRRVCACAHAHNVYAACFQQPILAQSCAMVEIFKNYSTGILRSVTTISHGPPHAAGSWCARTPSIWRAMCCRSC